MNVESLATRDVRSCLPATNLAHAAVMMFESDCGMLPVVNAEGKVLGTITDRDIAIAVGTQDRSAREIAVGEVMSRSVLACQIWDEIRSALKTMAQNKVRRLPVVDEAGKLRGVLSINDVILKANGDVNASQVVETLRAICEHYPRKRKLETAGARKAK